MTDFKALAEKLQAEKAEKLQAINTELETLKKQLSEAETKQAEAVNSGDQKAFTQVGHNMDYLKRRISELESRADDLEHKPLEDHDTVIKRRAELSELQRAAEREKMITFINDWETLKAHVKETAAAFNAENAKGMIYSREVLQDDNENLTYHGHDFNYLIREVESGFQFVAIKEAEKHLKERYPERFKL